MDKNKDRAEALKWAYELLQKPFYILDTETTGIKPQESEAVQISVIDEKGNTIYNSLVKPKGPMDPGAEAIHHKTADVLSGAPTFDQIYETLKSLLGNKLIICYNEWYDHGILDHTCDLYGLPHIEANWDCAQKAFAQYNGEWNTKYSSYTFKKLVYAIEHFKLEVENAHDALGDVIMTLRVIEKMAELHVRETLKLT